LVPTDPFRHTYRVGAAGSTMIVEPKGVLEGLSQNRLLLVGVPWAGAGVGPAGWGDGEGIPSGAP
jgi:hypothetical protein